MGLDDHFLYSEIGLVVAWYVFHVFVFIFFRALH